MLDPQPARDVTDEEPELTSRPREAVRSVAGTDAELHVYRQGTRLLVVTSVHADRALTVRAAHVLASRVEDAVRERLSRRRRRDRRGGSDLTYDAGERDLDRHRLAVPEHAERDLVPGYFTRSGRLSTENGLTRGRRSDTITSPPST